MNEQTEAISETLTSVVLTATSGDFPSITIVAESNTTQTQITKKKTFFTQKNYWYRINYSNSDKLNANTSLFQVFIKLN